MIVELWPGDVIALCRFVAASFHDDCFSLELFAKIGDFRNYEGELLQLTPVDASNWLQSLTVLQAGFCDRAGIDQVALSNVLTSFARRELVSQADIRQGFDQVAGSFAGIARLRRTIEESPEPTIEMIQNNIVEAAFSDAMKLCRASIDTGSPILLRW